MSINYEEWARSIERNKIFPIYIVRKIKRGLKILKNRTAIKENISKRIEVVFPEYSAEEKAFILSDCFKSCFVFGATDDYFDNYFKFGFNRLNSHERLKYSVETGEIVNSLIYDWGYFNKPDFYKFFEDKVLFAETFKKYYKRNFIAINYDTRYEDFLAFYRKQKNIFLKPNFGLLGRGCFKANIESDKPEEVWEKIHKKDVEYLAEDVVCCEESIAEFHRNSVNTIRIISLVTKNGPIIIGAYQRFGNGGACTDHSNVGAISALIDLDTGVVCTRAIDKKNHYHIYHPYSGKLIPGYQIKNWNSCKEMVMNMAMEVPQVRLVGWDVAINQDSEWVVIEGNHNCGYETIQHFSGGLQSLLNEKMREDNE